MTHISASGPQHGPLFRVIAFLTRLRFRYLLRGLTNHRLLTVIFVFSAGATALGTITMMAYLTDLMLLFPPLGPSAFILFHTPLAESASPRNVIMAHTLALLAGLGSFAVAGWVLPDIGAHAGRGLDWSSVAAMAMAMGAASVAMVGLRCIHPPAAATALIAAMGYFSNIVQISGVLIAVLMLVLEAILFNRILGGMPYPLWRFDPKVIKEHPSLAGLPKQGQSPWQKMVDQTFRHR